MMIAKFAWEKLRRVNRLPGAHAVWRIVTNLRYRNGRVVTLRNGPATGMRWRHYTAYQTWMAMGLYEPHVAQLLIEQLHPGDVFYDIGGNAGYFTLVGARKVGAQGRVITFDPLPLNVQTIEEQIALNQLGSICQVEPLAIADRCDTFEFVIPPKHSTANAHLQSVAPHVSDEGRRIEVLAVTLDSYVRDHPRPTLIKIDVEGAEVAALRGASNLLDSADAPILLVSTHSDTLEAEVRTILEDHSYTFRNLEGFRQMVFAQPPATGVNFRQATQS